jgi:hypothetical protein
MNIYWTLLARSGLADRYNAALCTVPIHMTFGLVVDTAGHADLLKAI